jgi:hypothetical protein
MIYQIEFNMIHFQQSSSRRLPPHFTIWRIILCSAVCREFAIPRCGSDIYDLWYLIYNLASRIWKKMSKLEEENDEVVREVGIGYCYYIFGVNVPTCLWFLQIPVFLSKNLLQKLYVFQYPLRSVAVEMERPHVAAVSIISHMQLDFNINVKHFSQGLSLNFRKLN